MNKHKDTNTNINIFYKSLQNCCYKSKYIHITYTYYESKANMYLLKDIAEFQLVKQVQTYKFHLYAQFKMYYARCYRYDIHQTTSKSGANQRWKKSHFKDDLCHGL